MDTGQVTMRETWVAGERDGAFTTYDSKTGAVEETGRYRKGKYHGVRKRYQNGKLQSELAYVDGETLGAQKEYNDGVLSRVYLKLPGSRLPDTEITFNKNGQVKSLKCGEQPIGKKDATWCGRDGRQSTVTLYSDDGKVSDTQQYLFGKEHGLFKRFNVRTGAVMREEVYENGQRLEAGQRAYNAKGEILAKTDCDARRTSCTETQYFEGGKETKVVTFWKAGKIDKRAEYYQNGKLREERLTVGDRFRITEYYDSGRVSSKGIYVLAGDWYWRPYLPDGLVESYDEDGALYHRGIYKVGRLDGKSERFWKEGGHAFRSEDQYRDDRLVSEKVFLDGRLADEFEYAPDGSQKSHKHHGPPTGTEI
jgi:antitoxin component YwqK of YwqJK toxin-antitoxin module